MNRQARASRIAYAVIIALQAAGIIIMAYMMVMLIIGDYDALVEHGFGRLGIIEIIIAGAPRDVTPYLKKTRRTRALRKADRILTVTLMLEAVAFGCIMTFQYLGQRH